MLKHKYAIVVCEEAVRNVEILLPENPEDIKFNEDGDIEYDYCDDSLWNLEEDAEMWLGIWEADSEEEAIKIASEESHIMKDFLRCVGTIEKEAG